MVVRSKPEAVTESEVSSAASLGLMNLKCLVSAIDTPRGHPSPDVAIPTSRGERDVTSSRRQDAG
jgi:hypothetical protein